MVLVEMVQEQRAGHHVIAIGDRLIQDVQSEESNRRIDRCGFPDCVGHGHGTDVASVEPDVETRPPATSGQGQHHVTPATGQVEHVDRSTPILRGQAGQ